MKTFTKLFAAIAALVFAGCSSTYHTTAVDDDDIYYSSSDAVVSSGGQVPSKMSKVENYTSAEGQQDEYYDPDYASGSNREYDYDDYYDYAYAARIRRFHQPVVTYGYYDTWYTNHYWYSYDPYYYGVSIYLGYDWWWPRPWHWGWYWGSWYTWDYGYYGWHWPYHHHHHYPWYGYHDDYYAYNSSYYYYNSYDKNSSGTYYGHRSSRVSNAGYNSFGDQYQAVSGGSAIRNTGIGKAENSNLSGKGINQTPVDKGRYESPDHSITREPVKATDNVVGRGNTVEPAGNTVKHENYTSPSRPNGLNQAGGNNYNMGRDVPRDISSPSREPYSTPRYEGAPERNPAHQGNPGSYGREPVDKGYGRDYTTPEQSPNRYSTPNYERPSDSEREYSKPNYEAPKSAPRNEPAPRGGSYERPGNYGSPSKGSGGGTYERPSRGSGGGSYSAPSRGSGGGKSYSAPSRSYGGGSAPSKSYGGGNSGGHKSYSGGGSRSSSGGRK